MKFTHNNQQYVLNAWYGYEVHEDSQDPRWPYVYVENTSVVLRAYREYQAELDAALAELEDLQATQDDASYRGQ